jgi:hypothetical protein
VSVAARLAGFAAILALAFGGAAFAGSRLDVRPGEPSGDAAEPAHGMGAEEEGGHGAKAPDAIRGLAVSDDGHALELERTTARAGKRFELAFRITGRDGATVSDFDVEHTKRMHVIIVRRDLTGFQHVHPVQRPDGSWTVPVALPDPGTYRVFADFSTQDEPRTLGADLTVDGAADAHPLPAPNRTVTTDGLDVRLTAEGEELGFEVTRDGAPVAVDDYLGAKGHLVALREGDLAFLHVHPDEDRLRFMAELPTAGRYRLFLQFQVDGEVHTAAFTHEVTR